MKKEFNLSKLFYAFAIAFSVVTLSSCDNDDNSPLPPPSTGDVAGTYNGKVLITQLLRLQAERMPVKVRLPRDRMSMRQ